jgi:hypothetical protein
MYGGSITVFVTSNELRKIGELWEKSTVAYFKILYCHTSADENSLKCPVGDPKRVAQVNATLTCCVVLRLFPINLTTLRITETT